MRNQQHYTDYNHIRVYGIIKGWNKAFITGQQQLAMMMNAPADTCHIHEDTVLRFYDLSKETRQQFNGVVINKRGN